MATYWKKDEFTSLSEVVCQVGTETTLLADLTTIQPSMTQRGIFAMKRFNPNFTEVGWLNNMVQHYINHRFFSEVIAMAMKNKKPNPLQAFAERGLEPFLECPNMLVPRLKERLPG